MAPSFKVGEGEFMKRPPVFLQSAWWVLSKYNSFDHFPLKDEENSYLHMTDLPST